MPWSTRPASGIARVSARQSVLQMTGGDLRPHRGRTLASLDPAAIFFVNSNSIAHSAC
jgi:hypothetical protein